MNIADTQALDFAFEHGLQEGRRSQQQLYTRLETAARAVAHGLHTMPTEQGQETLQMLRDAIEELDLAQ